MTYAEKQDLKCSCLVSLITPTSWSTHLPSELRGLLVVPSFSLLEVQWPLLGKLLGDRVCWGSWP